MVYIFTYGFSRGKGRQPPHAINIDIYTIIPTIVKPKMKNIAFF